MWIEARRNTCIMRRRIITWSWWGWLFISSKHCSIENWDLKYLGVHTRKSFEAWLRIWRNWVRTFRQIARIDCFWISRNDSITQRRETSFKGTRRIKHKSSRSWRTSYWVKNGLVWFWLFGCVSNWSNLKTANFSKSLLTIYSLSKTVQFRSWQSLRSYDVLSKFNWHIFVFSKYCWTNKKSWYLRAIN